MEITIRVRGTRASVLAAIHRAASLGNSSSPQLQTALVRVGLAALQKIHGAYAVKATGGTDEAGTRWAPLSPVTIRRRKRRPSYRVHQGTPILRDTDALYNSLSPACEPQEGTMAPPAVDGQVFRLEGTAVVLGTKIPHAHFHDRGIPGKLPRRPPIPETSRWPPPWWQAILEQAREGFIEILKTELER